MRREIERWGEREERGEITGKGGERKRWTESHRNRQIHRPRNKTELDKELRIFLYLELEIIRE